MPSGPAKDFTAILTRPDVREAGYEVLFNESPVGVAFVDSDGMFMRVNQAFCDLLGYTVSELEGHRTTQELTHPDDVEADKTEAAVVASGKRRGYRMSKRYLHKRGGSVPVDITVDRVDNKLGEFVHFVSHTQAVQLSEQFYRLQTNEEGKSEIVPFYPAIRMVRDNWKALAVVFGGLLTSAGAVVRGHYQSLGQLEAQTVQLQALERENKQVRDDLHEATRMIRAAKP